MTQPPDGDRLAGLSVLLVDDEDIVRLALARMIRGFGCTVTDAPSPARALELAGGDAAGFQVLVTDIVMPGMNGRELAARLREDRPDLPVVFMSAYVPETAFPDGRIPDGARFMHKPFSRDDLRESLEAVLGAS